MTMTEISPSLLYTVNDIKQIINNGFTYSLPAEVLKHIRTIETEMGLSSNCKAFEPTVKTNYRSQQKPRQKQEKDELSWENIRNFKTTKIEKKEGIEKRINDVRICLNKMSNKNYDVQRDAIRELISAEDVVFTDEELQKIALAIFDIASTNKFYSEMYAKLYGELIHLYPIFQSVMDCFLLQYMDSLREIKYADPNKDYDLFCVYTKQSDKRKATAQFMIHMMRETIVSVDYVVKLIDDLTEKVQENMDTPDRINEVEEITELVNILVSQGIASIRSHEDWSPLSDRLRQFAKYKMKEKVSLSSRIIFKYMDLVAILDKNL